MTPKKKRRGFCRIRHWWTPQAWGHDPGSEIAAYVVSKRCRRCGLIVIVDAWVGGEER